jgi:hypothetical protein
MSRPPCAYAEGKMWQDRMGRLRVGLYCHKRGGFIVKLQEFCKVCGYHKPKAEGNSR